MKETTMNINFVYISLRALLDSFYYYKFDFNSIKT